MARQLTIRRLTVRYRGQERLALGPIDLTVQPAGRVAVLGPTGAGKSTLLHAIAGVLPSRGDSSYGGTVHLGERDIVAPPEETAFPDVALVPQQPRALFSRLTETLDEEIALSIGGRAASGERVPDLASLFDRLGLRPLLARSPQSLSGGETTMAALGTMLAAQPEVLLLDEPHASLDQTHQRSLARMLATPAGGRGTMLAEPNLTLAALLCDRIVVLKGGEVAFDDTPSRFWREMGSWESVVGIQEWTGVQRRWPDPSQDDLRTFLEGLC